MKEKRDADQALKKTEEAHAASAARLHLLTVRAEQERARIRAIQEELARQPSPADLRETFQYIGQVVDRCTTASCTVDAPCRACAEPHHRGIPGGLHVPAAV